MEIRVQKIRETLQLLSPAVPKKPTLAILGYALLQDGWAMATDLEIGIAVELPEAEGKHIVPFRLMTELLKRIPYTEMLNLQEEERTLRLTWSGGAASFDLPADKHYPALPEVPGGVAHTITDGDALVSALVSMAEYCATDEKRPVLSGVTLSLGDPVTATGADGFRLVHQALPVSIPDQDDLKAAVIPAKACRALGYLWQRAPGNPMDGFPAQLLKRTLELTVTTPALYAKFGRVDFVTKLIQGTPPDYGQHIPTEEIPHKVRMSARDLERAVCQVSDMAGESSGIARLVWSDGSLMVSARSEKAGSVEVTVPVAIEGGNGRVALNVNYLLGYLKGKEGIVTMGVRTDSTPVLFTHRPSPMVVIMPMFAQWADEQPEPEEVLEPTDNIQDEEVEPADSIEEEEAEPAEEPVQRPEKPKRARRARGAKKAR